MNRKSHPTWVRGLKPMTDICPYYEAMSHPTWVRGLKPDSADYLVTTDESHPTWVRGLKQDTIDVGTPSKRRTLHGCVD